MATKVKATFTGKDDSCGYKNGKEYTLLISHTDGGRGLIDITSTNSEAGFCSYNSFHALMRNWNNIQSL